MEYDGTNYHGWQIQPNDITVQGVLENAVKEIFKEDITVTGCSRTDAGVHAKKYACSFLTNCKIPCDKVAIALNTKLPYDIRAISCKEVDNEFHARFNTVSKTYNYIINNNEYDVFKRNYSWYVDKKLDVNKMKKASKHFIGMHDFRAFMTGDKDNTERKIFSLDIKEKNGFINIFITADGYLYNMVRIITGTLKEVGEGKINPSDIKTIIESKDRTKAGPTAPPYGLYLYDVKY